MSLPDLSSLIRETQNPIAVFDDNDQLRYANPAFREAFNLSQDAFPTWVELMRHGWETQTGTEVTRSNGDFEKWLSSALSRRGTLPFRGFETSLHDGRWIWTTETIDAHGWMLYIGVDISSLAVDGRDLRSDRDAALKVSFTDELTGVSNRRYMMQRLAAMISNKTQGCIAVLDIDHFKLINDTYGHEGGDAVLMDFAHTVRHAMRRGDDFGRIGGEEFLFLFPGMDPTASQRLLDRIRQRLLDASPITSDLEFRYTFSVGITAVREGDTSNSILSRADRACYEAKNKGRDCTVCL